MQGPAQKFPSMQKIISPTKFLLPKAQVQVGDCPGLPGELGGGRVSGGEREAAQEKHPLAGEGTGGVCGSQESSGVSGRQEDFRAKSTLDSTCGLWSKESRSVPELTQYGGLAFQGPGADYLTAEKNKMWSALYLGLECQILVCSSDGICLLTLRGRPECHMGQCLLQHLPKH